MLMHVRDVRMPVFQSLVPMGVRMGLTRRIAWRMFVLMVGVVNVSLLPVQRFSGTILRILHWNCVTRD